MKYSLPEKTIWVITYNFDQVKAGPVIRFIRYIPLFRKRGYELFFVTKHRGGSTGYRVSESGVISYHITCNSLWEFTRESLKLIQKFDSPPTYLLFFSLHYLNFWDLKKISKRGIKCMYVSTMQISLEVNQNTKKERSWIRKRLLAFMYRNLYSLMDEIVSSTYELRQDFVNLNISDNKLKTICNGVDTEKFKPANSEEQKQYRKELNLPMDEFIFLYVGLFVDRKGADDLIRTFTELYKRKKNFILLMVGQEKDGYENSSNFNINWQEYKRKALKEGWLIVHPFSESIQDYYKAVDTFVFMSKLEGMPNVILEAMASGLPVLTTKFKGFSSDYGFNRVHYLILDRNYQNYAFTLSEVMDDKSLRRQISINARERAISLFEVNHIVDQYCMIFSATSR